MPLKYICENTHRDIKCDDGKLDIISASYGRTMSDPPMSDGETCIQEKFASCTSYDAWSYAYNLCQNKSKCTLYPHTTTLKVDQYLGTLQYLKVDYQCARRQPTTSTTNFTTALSTTTATTFERTPTVPDTTIQYVKNFVTTDEKLSAFSSNATLATDLPNTQEAVDTSNLGVLLGSLAVGLLLLVPLMIAAFVFIRKRTKSEKSNSSAVTDDTKNKPPTSVTSMAPITDREDRNYEMIKDGHPSNADDYITPRVYPNDSDYEEPVLHPASQPHLLPETSGYQTLTILPGNETAYTQYDVTAFRSEVGQEYEITKSEKSNSTEVTGTTNKPPTTVASMAPIADKEDRNYEMIKDGHPSNADDYITPRMYPNDGDYEVPSTVSHPSSQPRLLHEASGYQTVTILPGNETAYTQYDVTAFRNQVGQDYEMYEKTSQVHHPESSLAEEPEYQQVAIYKEDQRKAANDDSGYVIFNM